MQVNLTRRRFPAAPTRAHALVLSAHPLADSFNQALADAWIRGATSAGATVQTIALRDLDFDPRLRGAYMVDQPLEPDLIEARDAIEGAAHLVFAFPVWWASLPAGLKGLIDRVFLPGWAFKTNGGALPDPGLAGRSGRLLVTMDAPTWYDRLVYRGAARQQLARGTLKFCGVKPVRISAFGGIGKSSPAQRDAMLAKARAAGLADGAALIRRFGAATPAIEAMG